MSDLIRLLKDVENFLLAAHGNKEELLRRVTAQIDAAMQECGRE